MDAAKYLAALKKDPRDPAAIRALGEIAQASQQWQELVEYLKREAELCEDASERAGLLFQKATINREKLKQNEDALKDTRDALAANPGMRAARELEWQLLIELARWQELASSLETESASVAAIGSPASASHAAALQLCRAEALEFRLNDPAGAEKACSDALALYATRLAHVPQFEIRASQARWDDVVQTLIALEASSSTFEEKAAWGMLHAHLLESCMGKPEEAEALLGSLIESAPPEGPPAWLTAALFARSEIQSANNGAPFAESLSRLLTLIEAEPEPASGEIPPVWPAAVMFRLGEITESGENGANALEKYRGAHERDPENPRHLRAMIRLQRGGNQEDLRKSCLAVLSTESSDKLASVYDLFMGRTIDLGLNRVQDALDHYLQARKLTPSLHLIETEAEAQRRLSMWNELQATRDEETRETQDDKLKAALLVERAQINQHRLNDPKGAAEAYRQALAIPATALGMVRALAQNYADLGDWENLARMLIGQERLVTDPAYLIHLGLRAADLDRRLGRDDEAFKALSGVVQRDGHNLEALLMLEEICYTKKSFQNLYGIQQRIIEALDPQGDAVYARAVMLDQATLLLRKLNNEPAASGLFGRVLESDPKDAAALMEMRSLAYKGGRWQEYFDLIKREADSAGRHPALLWRAALGAWGRLNSVADATDLLKEILPKGPPSAALLEMLMTLQFLGQAWMPWLESAAGLLQLLDDPGKVTLFYEMARVHRYRLNSLNTAAECYDRIIELDRDNFVAYESLCLANLESGEMKNLRKIHSALIGLEASPPARAAYSFSRGEIAYKTGAFGEAEADWRAALKDAQNDLATLRRLERLYAESNNVNAHIEILQHEIKLRNDPRMLILLLLRQGDLWDKEKRPDEAISCYAQVLVHDIQELDALEALTRLYRSEEKWKELAINLERHAGVVPAPGRKIELHTERAKVWEEHLDDVKQAIAGHNAALDVNPKYIPSLSELERLYFVEESWEDELGVLKRLLDLAGDPAEQHRIHFKMGSIYELHMTAPSAAIMSFVKAHDLDPQHLETLDSLERLYTQGQDAAHLAPILEEKAALLPDERIRLYMWIGRLWDESLSDTGKAIASFERIIPLDPRNLDAINALESLYQRTGQWEKVIRTVMVKADAVPDPAESVELLNHAGALWIEKFKNDEEALKAYEKALTINPRHRPSLAKLREIFARLGRWEDVVGAYTREVEFVAEPNEKAILLTAMGQVVEIQIGNDARASQNYELALRSNPNHLEAIRPLARIYFKHKKWEQADPLYTKWVNSLTPEEPAPQASQVLYERGRVYQALSRDKEAIEAYRRSIEMRPDYLDPWQAKSELHAARKEFGEALEAETRVFNLLNNQGDQAAAGKSSANMGAYAEKVGKADEAIRHYTRSLEMAGDSPDTLENLVRLYSDKNLFNNAAGFFDRLIALFQGKPEEAHLRLRKGIILEDKIGDKQHALNEYTRAIEIAPTNAEALKRQAGVLIKLFKWEEAAQAAGKLISVEKDPARLADAHCLMGRIEQEGRKNLQGARAAYDKALQAMPSHLGAMDAIGTILEALEDWTGYVQTFERFLKNIPASSLTLIRDVHLRLGGVQRDRLKNRDRAIIEFGNAVKADSDCEPAHAALAKLYVQDKSMYQLAIRENNLLLKNNALIVDAYQDMAKIFEEQKKTDEAFCLYTIIDIFDALGKWHKANLEALQGKVPASSTKIIDDETHERVMIHPMAKLPATVLLEGLGAALSKLLPTGAHSGSLAPATHSARKKAQELAKNLGVEEFEIYLDESQKPGVSWHSGSPLGFVINPAIYEKASENGKRFMLGRGLGGVRNGLATIWSLNELEVKKRLQLVVKLFKPEVVVTGMNDKDAQALLKSLKKEVPRKVRKAIEDAAANHYTQERTFNFDPWRAGLIHSANRSGLIVSGNPGDAAIALLLIEDRIKPGQPPTKEVLQNSEQVAELFRFAVTDQHFLARKRTGFSLY